MEQIDEEELTLHCMSVPCAKCGKPLNGEPYYQERWKRYHIKCLPPESAWTQKARRAAKKAMKAQVAK